MPVTLKTLGSTKTWIVVLERDESGMYYFTRGWPAFVRDNFIEHGDFLNVFVDQELDFLVLHYDKSCCPKDKSFRVHSAQPKCTPTGEDATTAPGASPSVRKGKKGKIQSFSFQYYYSFNFIFMCFEVNFCLCIPSDSGGRIQKGK